MLCELKLDLCVHSHFCIMKNARTCIDLGNNVTCMCLSGWGGSNCGVNIDDCVDSKCKNGGSCVDKLNNYECRCKDGYTGLFCEDMSVTPHKLIPDIAIKFMADDCHKFQVLAIFYFFNLIITLRE